MPHMMPTMEYAVLDAIWGNARRFPVDDGEVCFGVRVARQAQLEKRDPHSHRCVRISCEAGIRARVNLKTAVLPCVIVV